MPHNWANSTSVTTTPYLIQNTDDVLSVTTSSLAITLNLPASPSIGDMYLIKDVSGNAASLNITVAGNGHLMDGTTSFVINKIFGQVVVLFNGTNWFIFSDYTPSGDITLAGDVTGAANANTVITLSGNAGSVQAGIGSIGAGAGTHLASKGLIQLPNNNNAGELDFIMARNNINSADLNIIGYDFGVLSFGNTAEVVAIVGNSVQLNTASGTPFVVNGSAALMQGLQTFQWSANTALPQINQVAPTTDVATTNLTISSQAPWASAVTHTSPGNLILNVPAPVTNGSVPGNIIVKSDGYTLATWGASGLTRGNSSIALTTGTVTLANWQYMLPRLTFTGSLSGSVTVVLPSSDGAEWMVDATACTLNGHTITLQANSNNFSATIGITSLYFVTYSAALGKLVGSQLGA